MTDQAVTGDRSRTTIRLIFLLQALSSGSIFTRIPDIQSGLGLDAGTLGLALIGQPVGAIATFLFTSRLVERFGTRALLLVAMPLMVIGLLLVALAPTPAALFAAIAAFSASFAATNVAMNVEADRVEAATGRRLMNTCHGLWSIGQLVVMLLGALVRGLHIPPAVHFGAIVPLSLIATALIILPMRPAPVRAHSAAKGRRPLALPTPATLRILGFMIGGSLIEAATRTWSVIYARDSFTAPDWADSLTLPVFVMAIAGGRFLADGWTHRAGPTRVSRVLMAVAFCGLVIVVFAPNLWVALAGFALMGVGVCTTFPASTSAAAQLGDRPSSENVAALTLSVQTVMLGAPPVMGLIADAFGIRTTYAAVLPFLILAIFLARGLEPRKQTHSS